MGNNNEWSPEFSEQVQVWDEGHKERLEVCFLGFVNGQAMCSYYPINGNASQTINTRLWDRVASIQSKIEIPYIEAQEEIAKIYGVQPSQIIIIK